MSPSRRRRRSSPPPPPHISLPIFLNQFVSIFPSTYPADSINLSDTATMSERFHPPTAYPTEWDFYAALLSDVQRE